MRRDEDEKLRDATCSSAQVDRFPGSCLPICYGSLVGFSRMVRSRAPSKNSYWNLCMWSGFSSFLVVLTSSTLVYSLYSIKFRRLRHLKKKIDPPPSRPGLKCLTLTLLHNLSKNSKIRREPYMQLR